jgi:hypothetical protein
MTKRVGSTQLLGLSYSPKNGIHDARRTPHPKRTDNLYTLMHDGMRLGSRKEFLEGAKPQHGAHLDIK